MDISVTATTNWNLIAGTNVAHSIQTKESHTEDFVKPDLDDILSADRAVLLNSGTSSNQPTCELNIDVVPKYKIDSLTVVCTSPKVELFNGPQCEYVETVYGERLEDEEQCDDIEGYRYDIEIRKSGVTHLMLKLITNSDELCIYGIALNVIPNPNGITTLEPNSINLDNVKEILNNSNQKLSPSAEKCKLFLESYKNAMSSGIGGSNVYLMEMFKKNMDLPSKERSSDLNEGTVDVGSAESLKEYIDVRVRDAETRILAKLDAMEEAQNTKLDQILSALQKNVVG